MDVLKPYPFRDLTDRIISSATRNIAPHRRVMFIRNLLRMIYCRTPAAESAGVHFRKEGLQNIGDRLRQLIFEDRFGFFEFQIDFVSTGYNTRLVLMLVSRF